MTLFTSADLAFPNRIKTLSLFSGAGGLDIGFHEAGYDIVAAVEIEPNYASTLSANTGVGGLLGPSLKVHCEDIRQFDAGRYTGLGIECVIGGPPCQTFSAAGRRSGGVLGTDDERGQLFMTYVDILRTLEPKVFVFENVYGLPGANGGGPWREIVDAFASVGYELYAEVLDAADYGVPQHRERLFMVGSRVGAFRFPTPTHGPDSSGGSPLVSAKTAIAGLSADASAETQLGGMYGHLLELVPEGLNYSYFTREMGHPAPQFAWRSKFHDFLYKADPNSPVRTIKSRPGKFTGPFHWENRHFTAAELKRLQAFPAEYQIVGSYNKVVEQIGNSVPPRLAYVLAISVREQLLDQTEVLSYPARAPEFKSTFRQRQRERNAHFHRVARLANLRRAGGPGQQPTAIAIEDDSYYAAFDGWFRRSYHVTEPRFDERSLILQIEARRSDDSLKLTVSGMGSQERRPLGVHILISGLEKYMDHTDVVDLTAQLASAKDILPVWAIIERELVRQSRFFSLIDIYGHYANRGDTVVVETHVQGGDPAMARAINYFGNSRNCGVPISIEAAAEALSVTVAEMPSWIDALRALRWDVRTKGTHPTLAAGAVLCTYPFPAVSEKAHFDKGFVGSPDGEEARPRPDNSDLKLAG